MSLKSVQRYTKTHLLVERRAMVGAERLRDERAWWLADRARRPRAATTVAVAVAAETCGRRAAAPWHVRGRIREPKTHYYENAIEASKSNKKLKV